MASTVSPFPQRPAPAEATPSEAPTLAGTLSQMPLPDLLQTVSNNGRTGRIDLKGGADADARHTGRIWLRDGRVIDAALAPEPTSSDAGSSDSESTQELAGREALYRLLTWTHGRFAMVDVDVDAPDRIQDSTSFLLLDAMRQIDEERRSESPGHAGLPEEPPEPSRAEQALHLSLLLLNVTSTWVGSHLRPALLTQRFEEVRDVLRQGHPQLQRFTFDPESGLAGSSSAELDDDEIEPLVASVGVWLRGFYRRLERSLPGKYSLERLAELTGAHADQLTALGFHQALGWPDHWPEDESSTELAVTPGSPETDGKSPAAS